MKRSFKLPPGMSFFALSALLVALAFFLQWKIIQGQQLDTDLLLNHETQLQQYRQSNIFYNPQKTAKWLASLQHPDGYFVASHDKLYEPSQLNSNTLSITRHAIVALAKLGSLESISRGATIEFVAELSAKNTRAGFSNQKGSPVKIKSTLDALVILKTLGALDRPFIKQPAINNFILKLQQVDGGFSEPTSGGKRNPSRLSTTAHAAQVLDILKTQQQSLKPQAQAGIEKFVNSTLIAESSGYTNVPGTTSIDSYDTYNAFISLWSIADGSADKRQTYVSQHLNSNDVFWSLIDNHFLTGRGAFSRYHLDEMKPSLTATQKAVELMTKLNLSEQINAEQIGKFAASQQAPSGQFGDGILSTHSAIILLQNLGIATKPFPRPVKPEATHATAQQLLPALVFLFSLIALLIGFLLTIKQLNAVKNGLVHTANTDDLTGIYNRKYFERTGMKLIKSCAENQQKMSLISVSVDDLNAINKTRGHLVGDNILERVVELITPTLHESYIFSRWGGGVFMVLAPGTDQQNASDIMKKIGMAIAEQNFGFKGILNCSFANTELSEGDNIQKMVARVDKLISKHQINKKKAAQIKVA